LAITGAAIALAMITAAETNKIGRILAKAVMVPSPFGNGVSLRVTRPVRHLLREEELAVTALPES
jgi:hypothetical protein